MYLIMKMSNNDDHDDSDDESNNQNDIESHFENDERIIIMRMSPVRPGPVLQRPAGADLRALQLSLGLCVRIELVLHKSVDKGTDLSI